MKLPPGVSAGDFAAALKEFEAAVGSEWVFTSDEDVTLYRDAYSPFWDEEEDRVASAAVAPDNVEQVQAVVRIRQQATKFRCGPDLNRQKPRLWRFGARATQAAWSSI